MALISLEKFIKDNTGKRLAVPWGYKGECVPLVQVYLHDCLAMRIKLEAMQRVGLVHWQVQASLRKQLVNHKEEISLFMALHMVAVMDTLELQMAKETSLTKTTLWGGSQR